MVRSPGLFCLISIADNASLHPPKIDSRHTAEKLYRNPFLATMFRQCEGNGERTLSHDGQKIR